MHEVLVRCLLCSHGDGSQGCRLHPSYRARGELPELCPEYEGPAGAPAVGPDSQHVVVVDPDRAAHPLRQVSRVEGGAHVWRWE